MQKCLDVLKQYCDKSGLHLNVDKTKILVFSRGKIRNLPNLFFNNEKIEVVFEYKYLGTLFNFNNKFQKAIKNQYLAANRALFSLIKKCRVLDLPIDIQIDLFNKCVVPILLYGCEVWGYENLQLCDKLQLRFLKLLLGVKVSTPSCMVYGEVGELPVSLTAKCRMLVYYYKLSLERKSDTTSHKYSCLLFDLCRAITLNNNNMNGPNDRYKFKWLLEIHSLLDSLGLSFIHQNIDQPTYTLNKFKTIVKQRLRDQYLQTWHDNIFNCNMSVTYRMYKTEFKYEPYLLKLKTKLGHNLTLFRLSSHRLPVQRLRYFDTPRQDRLCTLCDKQEMGDEYHYIFSCSYQPIADKRTKCIRKSLYQRPTIFNFQRLMNITSRSKLTKLAQFISEILTQCR